MNDRETHIDADTIECDTAKARCIATGHAFLTLQQHEIHGDRISAVASTSSTSKNNGAAISTIERVDVIGHVKLKGTMGHATGASARYLPATHTLSLYGPKAQLITHDGFVSSHGTITYNHARGLVEVTGGGLVRHNDTLLEAQHVRAQWNSHNILTAAEAWGDVIITTPNDVITASYARYDPRQQTLELSQTQNPTSTAPAKNFLKPSSPSERVRMILTPSSHGRSRRGAPSMAKHSLPTDLKEQ